jgi:hypothetical protein
MAKINAYALPRPERPVVVRTFSKDGEPFTLAIRAADESDKMVAMERQEHLVRLYVTGDGDREPACFPDPEIRPSRLLIQSGCLIREMQAPEDPRDVYDEMELIHLSCKRPRDWEAVKALCGQVQLDWEHDSPNSPGAPTAG